MLEDAAGIRRVVIACGYVDYPRSIIIREDCCNHLQLQHYIKNFSNKILSLFQKVWNIVCCFLYINFFDYHQTMFHSIPLISYQLYPETFRHKSVLSGLKHVLIYFLLLQYQLQPLVNGMLCYELYLSCIIKCLLIVCFTIRIIELSLFEKN